ncbi:ATP-dependent acyl-CoA ligase [Amycolatopsis sp. K13G38]|uniref:ATP-dependent acyl-CoA ligase n=1 Tax=Amycolatopsis acididurans TaxID=2724524 RepID=A0ABX1IW64_9PSEU|nr:AMP-binding protein [Amycolatopsis acididurans]NKQ51726.1 ATP-dependent acyl-CoA ligase [Amycolatopsis acididurans]
MTPVRSFAEAVLARAETAPGDEVIRPAGEPGWTAARLAERATAIARGLTRLAGPGDLVATAVRNGPEAVALTTALSMLGAVELPLPAELDAGWARQLAKSGGCVATIADSARLGGEPHLAGLAESTVVIGDLGGDGPLPRFVPELSTPALVMTTSGTTGRPKGAVLPNGAGLGQARRVQRAMRYDSSDVLYNFFPWQHINARHAAFLPALLGGSVLVVGRRFSASRFWDMARAEGVTAFNFMGAVCVMLLRQHERDRSHPVRRAYGGPAPAWLVHEMAERFGVRLLQAYACTELGDVATTPVDELCPGAAGRPVPEYEVRVSDGELLVRPQCPDLTFTGYLGDPDATEAAWRDGWFRTGDQARIEDGWLYFEGRSADVIRRRGINISAVSVEEAAASMPGVAAAAAVGVASELTEDEVLLVVVPAPGETLDPAAVRAHCAARLPRHSVPRYVSVEKDLPRNGSLKVVRAPLRDRGLPPTVWDAEEGGTR